MCSLRGFRAIDENLKNHPRRPSGVAGAVAPCGAAFASRRLAAALLALPQRDGIASIRIGLISCEPLVLESFYIAPQGCRLLVRRLKAIPLAGDDPTPNDTHIHVRLLCFLRASHSVDLVGWDTE